jgi:acetyl esterase
MSLTRQLLLRNVRRIFRLPGPMVRALAGAPKVSPEGYRLDAQLQLLLRLMQLEPELHELGVERSRRRMDRNAPVLDHPPRAVDTVDVASPVPVRVYRPSNPGGVIVYFHGGGWVIGSIASHDRLCRALAEDVGALVVSVGYRLAPEHRYPAAVEDALLATGWALDHAGEHGGDPGRLAVAGDSAGGSLAATVALRMRDRVRLQLLVYPSTDLTCNHASHEHFRDGFLLTKASMEWFLDHYVPADRRREPMGSPLFADDLQGAPPAMVMTAGFDPLRDEGRAYAARLQKAGVAVEDRLYPSLIHGFFSMAGAIPAARAAYDDAVSFLSAGLRAPA